MLSVPDSVRVFVARHPVDFRKQFDGLAAIVRDEFDMDPLCGHVFAFFNKRRDRIKILVFQHTGFWLHYKRLERGTFEVMDDIEDDCEYIAVDARQIRLILDGIDLRKTQFRRHFRRPLIIDERGSRNIRREAS